MSQPVTIEVSLLEAIEQEIERGTVDVLLLYRKVHEEELWRERYESFEEWLLFRFGITTNHLCRMMELKLPPRLRQSTLWDLPVTASDGDLLQRILDAAASKNNPEVARLARASSDSLRTRADAERAKLTQEELEKNITAVFSRLQAAERKLLWIDGIRLTDLMVQFRDLDLSEEIQTIRNAKESAVKKLSQMLTLAEKK